MGRGLTGIIVFAAACLIWLGGAAIAADSPATKALLDQGKAAADAKDLPRARTLYDQACQAGSGDGCIRLGGMTERGEGGAKDPNQAAARYDRACTLGSAAGCRVFGFMLWQGRGIPKDAARAAKLYDRACTGGDAPGCRNLGIMHGAGDGVPKDAARQFAFYSRSCELGAPDGCGSLALSLLKGRGVARDAARAVSLYQGACDKGIGWACTALGDIYREGEYADRDTKKATALYNAGCKANDWAGCVGIVVNIFSLLPSQPASATTSASGILTKACDAGNGKGCGYLANMHDVGGTLPRDDKRMGELLEKGCALNSGYACARLAAYVRRIQNNDAGDAREIKLLQRACELENGGACTSLYIRYKLAKPPQHDKGTEARRRACLFEARPCFSLGVDYEFGEAPYPVDRAQAMTLYTEACERRDIEACGRKAILHRLNGQKAQALALFQKGCDRKEALSCAYLGLALHRGDGIARDEQRGRLLLIENACRVETSDPCMAGAAFGDGVNATLAFEQICDGRTPIGEACYRAGMGNKAGLDQHRSSPDRTPYEINKNEIMALRYFNIGCTMHGDPQSCAAWKSLCSARSAKKNIYEGYVKPFDVCRTNWPRG